MDDQVMEKGLNEPAEMVLERKKGLRETVKVHRLRLPKDGVMELTVSFGDEEDALTIRLDRKVQIISAPSNLRQAMTELYRQLHRQRDEECRSRSRCDVRSGYVHGYPDNYTGSAYPN